MFVIVNGLNLVLYLWTKAEALPVIVSGLNLIFYLIKSLVAFAPVVVNIFIVCAADLVAEIVKYFSKSCLLCKITSCGLCYKCVMIVIYDRGDSGQYYKRVTIIRYSSTYGS